MRFTARLACMCSALFASTASAQAPRAVDPADWPMYNRDVKGWRFNPVETALTPATAPKLAELWRFPAEGSDRVIGVVHATPAVVGGEVYFGTATDPAFYKLKADGSLAWTYRNPRRKPVALPKPTGDAAKDEASRNNRFLASGAEGIVTSALVTAGSVYFGDIGGVVYAIDRETGKERWTLDTRAATFPDAHALNSVFASPIPADGKIIVAGGSLEQLVVGSVPSYRGSTGRGFFLAIEPETGAIAWKYDLGPKAERLVPPIVIETSWGKHTFHFGPATSSIWCTPSFDEESGTIFFGTDVNTAPRKPTADNPDLHTRESCAIVALDVKTGRERWVRQINPGNVWTNAMRGYDPKTGRYKDVSVGDTPKLYTILIDGTPTKVVGAGCKDGGFYVLRADDGTIVAKTPTYSGPPEYPLSPAPDPRMLALPGLIGGLQTGCSTDGKSIVTNGVDAVRLGNAEKPIEAGVPPTGGRVVSIGLDTKTENWRHERPKVASLGGPAPKPAYSNVGDPVASGVALAGGVAYFTTVGSGKLVALDASNGTVLKEIPIGPVWSGPSVSRGRVYVGTGNTLFSPADYEAFFPKRGTGTLHCFGLPPAR